MRWSHAHSPAALLALALTVSAASAVQTLPVAAQDVIPVPETIRYSLADLTVVTRFEDAAGIGVTADAIYVVDRGRRKVGRIRLDTGAVEWSGGSGSENRRLVDPVDVDPTNGLNILVADAAGYIHRFDRSFAHIESINLRATPRSSNAGVESAWVEPAFLASVDERTTYLVDASSNTLLRWTRDRGVVRVDVDTDRSWGLEPVDLAASPSFLYVADAASGCVNVMDAFGTPDRRFGCGDPGRIRAVTITSEAVHVSRQEKDAATVHVYRGGVLNSSLRFSGLHNIIGAMQDESHVWIADRNTLYRAEIKAGG